MESEGRDAPRPEDPEQPTTARIHRLHPATLVFRFLGHAKTLIVPALVVLLLARGERWEMWLGLFVIPAMVYEVYRYLSLRYRLEAGELILTEGVVFRNERHIPFGRIQNVDWTQGILQRMVGVAELRIETAGGSEPEANLAVLSVKVVESIRERIFAGRSPGGAAQAATAEQRRPLGEPALGEPALGEPDIPGAGAPRTLLSLPAGELLRLGLSPGPGVAGIFVLLGVAWELDLFEDLPVLDSLSAWWKSSTGETIVLAGAAGALALLLVVMLLSAASMVLRLHGFRLARVGEDFRIHCGLLTRTSATIPRKRIQFLSVHESPLHRWMGRVTVRIETAGGGGDFDEEPKVGRRWFLPLVRRAELPPLLREIDPALDLEGVDWTGPTAAARRRMRRAAVILSLVGAAVALPLAWPWGGLVLPGLLLPFLWLVQREVRFMAYARTPYGVLFRNGALYRKTSATFLGKVQAVSTTASPFDRRWGMASLAVDTAGAGSAGHRIAVSYLPDEVAAELRADLLAGAQRARFEW